MPYFKYQVSQILLTHANTQAFVFHVLSEGRQIRSSLQLSLTTVSSILFQKQLHYSSRNSNVNESVVHRGCYIVTFRNGSNIFINILGVVDQINCCSRQLRIRGTEI